MSIAMVYTKGSAMLAHYLAINGFREVSVWAGWVDRPCRGVRRQYRVSLDLGGGIGSPYEGEYLTRRDAVAQALKLSEHTGLPYKGIKY